MKVVINKKFGGFGLSAAAYKRYLELKGKKCYFYDLSIRGNKSMRLSVEEAEQKGFFFAFDTPYSDSKESDREWWKQHHCYSGDIERNDPDLIKVVEELGINANGHHANLVIVDIPDGVNYSIEDYDGMESIHEVHRSWG